MYGRCHILLRRPEPIAHDFDRLPDSCRHLRDLILWCHGISLFMPMDETLPLPNLRSPPGLVRLVVAFRGDREGG